MVGVFLLKKKEKELLVSHPAHRSLKAITPILTTRKKLNKSEINSSSQIDPGRGRGQNCWIWPEELGQVEGVSGRVATVSWVPEGRLGWCHVRRWADGEWELARIFLQFLHSKDNYRAPAKCQTILGCFPQVLVRFQVFSGPGTTHQLSERMGEEQRGLHSKCAVDGGE